MSKSIEKLSLFKLKQVSNQICGRFEYLKLGIDNNLIFLYLKQSVLILDIKPYWIG